MKINERIQIRVSLTGVRAAPVLDSGLLVGVLTFTDVLNAVSANDDIAGKAQPGDS